MTTESTIEKAKAVIEEMRELLAKLQEAKDAKPARNWPERIEAGMCFGREDVRYVLFGKRLANIESGVIWSTNSDPFGGDQGEFDYLGKIDLTIRTDAHEPTGAELVGVLEDIRNVSNNPGRTLTTLGLTECLQSCNVMARNALEGLAK